MSDIDIRQLLLDAEENANSENYIESANLYKKVTIIDENIALWKKELNGEWISDIKNILDKIKT